MLAACDVCYIGLTADPLFKFGVSPNKLFDYLISGKPVLYGIDSGKFKPVERYDAGLTVPAEDPQALADAIRRIHAMPEQERRRMGENGDHEHERQHHRGQQARELVEPCRCHSISNPRWCRFGTEVPVAADSTINVIGILRFGCI